MRKQFEDAEEALDGGEGLEAGEDRSDEENGAEDVL